MTLLIDSYALIELFKGTEKGADVKKLLEKDKNILVSVLSLYEVGFRIEHDSSRGTAQDYLKSLKTYYTIIPVTEDIAQKAVEMRAKFKLPAIDSLIYATAKLNHAKVVSGCSHFKAISKEADVIII